MIHRDKGVEIRSREQHVGAGWSLDLQTYRTQPLDRRHSDPLIVIAEETVFTGVGIYPEQAEAWAIDTQVD
jgi:hypothetical protein